MTATLDGQLKLAARLQEALTETEVTQAYLEVVPEVIGARGRAFYRLDGDAASVVADVSADFLADYEERGRAGDPVLAYVQAHRRPVDQTRACTLTDWHASPVHDVLRGAGFYHSLEAPVLVSGAMIGTINFARGVNDQPFSQLEVSAAGQAAEQLGLAVQRAMRFEQSGRRASLLETALDRLPQAVAVTDLDGRVIYLNRAAAALIELARPQLDAAAVAFRAGSRVAVASQDKVTVKCTRLPEAMLALIYPRAEQELPLWDVLSPREQQIAEWVSQGLTNRQISERAVVTENTVKQHLKRIFAKAGVVNRAGLVQRVWAAGRPAP